MALLRPINALDGGLFCEIDVPGRWLSLGISACFRTGLVGFQDSFSDEFPVLLMRFSSNRHTATIRGSVQMG